MEFPCFSSKTTYLKLFSSEPPLAEVLRVIDSTSDEKVISKLRMLWLCESRTVIQ